MKAQDAFLLIELPYDDGETAYRLDIVINSFGTKPNLHCPGDEPEWDVLDAMMFLPNTGVWAGVGVYTVDLEKQIQKHQDHIHTAVCDHLTAQGLR